MAYGSLAFGLLTGTFSEDTEFGTDDWRARKGKMGSIKMFDAIFGEESFLSLPHLKDLKSLFEGPQYARWRSLRAFRASFRRNSNTVPWKSLLPDFVVRLMTPPLNLPKAAEESLVCTLNSRMASMMGKKATCPGSGCKTPRPS